MAIEIVDLPMNSMVMFHSYVSLPEAISWEKPLFKYGAVQLVIIVLRDPHYDWFSLGKIPI